MQSALGIAVLAFLLMPACRAASPGRIVDVGGLSLHLHCVGAGVPIVVLEAGLGNAPTPGFCFRGNVFSIRRLWPATIGLRMLAWGVPGAYCRCLRHDVSSVVFFAYPGQSTRGKRGYFGKLGSRSCKRQRRNTEPRAEPTRLQCRQRSQRPASGVTIHTKLLAGLIGAAVLRIGSTQRQRPDALRPFVVGVFS
jgi:hypothetical protein